MFDNIGLKIKMLAKFSTIIGIVISCIVGFVAMLSGAFLMGLLYALIGALIAWVGSFLLYGFGELVENNQIIACYCMENPKNNEGAQSNSSSTLNNSVKFDDHSRRPQTMKSCHKCGGYYDVGIEECPHCGNKT